MWGSGRVRHNPGAHQGPQGGLNGRPPIGTLVATNSSHSIEFPGENGHSSRSSSYINQESTHKNLENYPALTGRSTRNPYNFGKVARSTKPRPAMCYYTV